MSRCRGPPIRIGKGGAKILAMLPRACVILITALITYFLVKSTPSRRDTPTEPQSVFGKTRRMVGDQRKSQCTYCSDQLAVCRVQKKFVRTILKLADEKGHSSRTTNRNAPNLLSSPTIRTSLKLLNQKKNGDLGTSLTADPARSICQSTPYPEWRHL